MGRPRILLLFFVLLFVAAAFYWYLRPTPSAGPTNTVVERPNLLFITVDTIRPDRIGAYGNRNIQTPTMDGLARDGVLFRNAVCQTPLTLVSHASIFTGLYPHVHGVRDNAYFHLSDQFKTLAEYLRELDFQTAAFVASAVLDSRYGLAQGFDFYSKYQTTIIGLESERRAEEVVADATQWFSGSYTPSRNFFVWLHLYDPHLPYAPPEPYRTRYSSIPYDGEIAYTDFVLGKFLEHLQGAGMLRNTLIVLMGDHGESLGEHREEDHGFFIYDATMKIPLILNWPGRLRAGEVAHQVQSVDLLPTIAELLNVKLDASLNGKSVVALMKGQSLPPAAAYTETFVPKLYYGWSELRSIRTADWKYIDAPEPELYDLQKDPAESNNVVSKQINTAGKMKAQLQRLIALESAAPQNAAASIDAERLEQLAALGYIGAENPGFMLSKRSTIDPKSKIDEYLLLHELVPQAVRLIDRAEYGKALELLRKVETKFTNSFVLHWYIGHCLAKLGQAEAAQKAYAKSIELNPYFGRAYTDFALALALSKRHADGLKLLQSVPSSALNAADLHFTRGEIYMNQGNFEQAEKSYLEALRSEPQRYEVEYGLARVYLASGRLEEAIHRLNNLMQARFPSEDVYYSLSALHQRSGRLPEAEKVLKVWLDLFPRSSEAYYNYAALLAAKGDKQQARTYLNKALELDPRSEKAAAALKSLGS